MGRGRKLTIGALGSIVLLGGVAIAWQRLHSHSSQSRTATPPEISAAVVEPEVRAVLTKARDRVINEPRSETAWGDLGLLFRAHKLIPEAITCFLEAGKLNTANPRWP